MRRFSPWRVGFVLTILVCFAWSLGAILLTGPVVARVPHVQLGIDVSVERLRADVRRLCDEFTPRDASHASNLERAAAWITAEMEDAGWAVDRQHYTAGETTYTNVLARQQGTRPELGTIVIGAHYDAYGPFPGADDNASGVAALLELARGLRNRPAPRHPRLFAFFSTEEPPIFGTPWMGSAVLARSLVDTGETVDLMIALDSLGYFSEAKGSQLFPHPVMRTLYPNRGSFIAVVGDLGSGPWIERVKRGMVAVDAIEVHSLRAPTWLAPVDQSDHRSFRDLGLPGVLVTDTAYMRNPHYHSATDTPDRLDYERLAAVVLALHGVLDEGTQVE